MSRPIRFFSKQERWYEFSNFYPSTFVADGERWPTVEHYFHAQKFPRDEDAAHRRRIREAGSPQQAKALGQSRTATIRPDWDQVRDEVMLGALRLKFADPALRELLLGTGKRELIEASPYDRYWGEGRDGKGKNRMGKLLMQLRDELRG